MNESELSRARAILQRLAGQLCRTPITEDRQPTPLALQFGKRLHRRRPCFVDSFIPEFRFVLGLNCAWRLERRGRVDCTLGETGSRRIEMQARLDELRGLRVVRVELTGPAGDLAIELEREIVLRSFCCIRRGRPGTIWDYYCIDDSTDCSAAFSVGPRGGIDFDWSGDPLPDR